MNYIQIIKLHLIIILLILFIIILLLKEFYILNWYYITQFYTSLNNIKNIKVCICTLAKKENKYIREFIKHYEKFGVDKIFLYDNNDIDGENFQDVISDYINKGFVEILNWRGKYLPLLPIVNDCYHKNYKTYNWLIFYEIDEYIHLYKYDNIKLFLEEDKFKYCQIIHLNLICHTDNNLLSYENKSLFERFPNLVPNTKPMGKNFEIKSIIRGNIEGVNITHNHFGDLKLKICNGFGDYKKSIFYLTRKKGDHKYFYIDHFYSKSTEEFIIKITKGDAIRNDSGYIYEKVDKYFQQSELSKEKIDLIEKKVHLNLSHYRKILNKR